MYPNGMFVVFGKALAPQVHLLGQSQLQTFVERVDSATKLARKHGRDIALAVQAVYEVIFSKGTEYVLPCNPECMAYVAQNYKGPHSEQLRALCATIALGQTWSKGKDSKSDNSDGGIKEKIQPKQPKQPKPGGAAVKVPALTK